MPNAATLRPSLVGRYNERQIVRLLQSRGPQSRAEVSRVSGLSAPTVSKAVNSLIASGLLEETNVTENVRGRPANKIRLATDTTQVIGVVIDREHCSIRSAGLDGRLNDGILEIKTPGTYSEIIEKVVEKCQISMAKEGIRTLGMAVSVPGLVDARTGKLLLCPNLPILNGHSPAKDLQASLNLSCWIVQELHGLCLAEKLYGRARDLNDYVLLEADVGLGVGVMLGGKLLFGNNGLAGELGHVTAVAHGGRVCGCGNRGCVETVASDSSLAWRISQRIGRNVGVDEAIMLAAADPERYAEELEDTAESLGIAAAACINLFNPVAVLIYTRMFDADSSMFDRVAAVARDRALKPSIEGCRIERAKATKQQGAIASAVLNVTDAVADGI